LADPNPIAYLMLLVWPVVAWQFYRRMDPARALIWTILGGYLLLPPIAAIDVPVIPAFDKTSIPNLVALAACLFLLRDGLPGWPRSRLALVLLGLFVLAPFATVLTNPDPIPIELAPDIPGMRIYDSIAVVANQAIYLLPFFLARRYLATEEAMRALLGALVVAGLIYSIPMHVEARLSPQLNVWIYGFFQHDFSQMIRFGGFRPIVFLPHGLWVAFFALMAAMSALLVLRQAPPARRHIWLGVWLWLMLMLAVCRSLGPAAYAAFLTPLILFAPRRTQLLVAATMAAIVITYPALRGAHMVPLDDILNYARSISLERAASLEYRIANEEVLLARAQEKPWFGWGGYGRALILDPITGRILSVPDGGWVIVLGNYGWLGYIAQFGLLVLPLLRLGRVALRYRTLTVGPWGAAMALIYGVNLIDLLPNNTLVPFTWLMAGALTGWAEQLAADLRKAAPADPAIQAPRPRRTIL
jgi:hypothetical protein